MIMGRTVTINENGRVYVLSRQNLLFCLNKMKTWILIIYQTVGTTLSPSRIIRFLEKKKEEFFNYFQDFSFHILALYFSIFFRLNGMF